MELDQDKIDAALAGAVTMANGAKPPMPPPPPPEQRDDGKPWYGKENLEKALVKEDGAEDCKADELDGETPDECCKADDYDPQETGINDSCSIAMSQQKFVEACYNLNIDARKCFYQSSKNEDKSIVNYIRAINKKIYDETQRGGYSTNVQFRVSPQDWVNISHITDWYKSRGFTIPKFESSSAAYGKDVGTIEYNFTISWSDAH